MTRPAKQPLDARRAKLQKFNALLERAKKLVKGDDEGLKAVLLAAVNARLSDSQIDALRSAGTRTTGIKMTKGFVSAAQEALKRRDDASPQAKADKKIAEKAAEIAKDAEISQLYASCKDIAESPALLDDLEAFIHRLGVIGEGASIRGTYIVGTSRLSRDTAISYLRRGASAAGKNHPILKILKLFPHEHVITISSATPAALIYIGDDENDRDALKHKIILITEAAVISRKANGDEHPMAAMIRTLLSDGKLDHRIPMLQAGGIPRTVHVQRDGPVSLMLTSARDDVERELLTRLMCSDADESDAQTDLVIAYGWSGRRAKVAPDEVERWVDFQRWLIAAMPSGGYAVTVPFDAAINAAHLQLIRSAPAARQLRTRRDVVAFRAAIEASAIIHKAQRRTDASGSIIATLDDYRHAHEAFNVGMAALYDLRLAGPLPAALAAAIVIVHEQAQKEGKTYDPTESYKIGVARLRKQLGINSNKTAQTRLEKLIELGAIEEDEENRGQGRGWGATRYYWIKKEKLDDGATGNVFPTIEAVERIWDEMQGGSLSVGGQGPKAPQPVDIASENALSPAYPPETSPQQDPSCPAETSGGQAPFNNDINDLTPKTTLSPNLLADPLTKSHGNGAEKPGDARNSSDLTAHERVAAAREAGTVFTVRPDGAGFDMDMDAVSDPELRVILQEAVKADRGSILDELKREPPHGAKPRKQSLTPKGEPLQ
jgi:hypothetical protein